MVIVVEPINLYSDYGARCLKMEARSRFIVGFFVGFKDGSGL